VAIISCVLRGAPAPDLEAAPDQIRRLDEKRPAHAPKPWLKPAVEGAETVLVNVVVIANVKRSAWIWSPSE